jgi:hypothetical protein
MSRLYLHCGLCGRKQADGLLSRGFWGHLQADVVAHTDGAHESQALSACPTCKQGADWEARLLATVPGATSLDRSPLGVQAR